MASAIAMDKVRTKQIWIAEGLPTPRYLAVDHGERARCRHAGARVAADREAAARGLDHRHHQGDRGDQLLEAFEAAVRFDREVMVEQFIEGRELTVAVLGTGADAVALPIVEIGAPDGNYDYQNKYFTDSTQYVCPAVLPASQTQRDPADRARGVSRRRRARDGDASISCCRRATTGPICSRSTPRPA